MWESYYTLEQSLNSVLEMICFLSKRKCWWFLSNIIIILAIRLNIWCYCTDWNVLSGWVRYPFVLMIRPWLQHNFSPIPFLENDSISIKSDSVVTVDWKRNGNTETEGPTRTDHFNLQLITYLASLLSGFRSYLFSELFLGKDFIGSVIKNKLFPFALLIGHCSYVSWVSVT